VISFKNDVEAALKYMMKDRSRTKDITAIKRNFMDLLEESFDEIFPKSASAPEIEGDDDSRLSKKRSRASDGDSIEEAANRKQSRPVKAEGNTVAPVKITYNQKVRVQCAVCSGVDSIIVMCFQAQLQRRAFIL
jgi:hypothetical protein